MFGLDNCMTCDRFHEREWGTFRWSGWGCKNVKNSAPCPLHSTIPLGAASAISRLRRGWGWGGEGSGQGKEKLLEHDSSSGQWGSAPDLRMIYADAMLKKSRSLHRRPKKEKKIRYFVYKKRAYALRPQNSAENGKTRNCM